MKEKEKRRDGIKKILIGIGIGVSVSVGTLVVYKKSPRVRKCLEKIGIKDEKKIRHFRTRQPSVRYYYDRRPVNKK